MPYSNQGLTPDTQERVDRLIEAARDRGWTVVARSTRRSCNEQNRLYAQGRTEPGPRVTNARGCMSWHVHGRAVDVAFKGMKPEWDELGRMGKELGFRWGGDFTGFPDVGHFEYHPDFSMEDVCPVPEECVDMSFSTEWQAPGCGMGPAVRWLENGYIELEGEGVLKRALPPRLLQWGPLFEEKAIKYQIPTQFGAGVSGLESAGDPKADSGVAYGLMQLTLPTAAYLAGREVSKEELWNDPELNVDLGFRLLSNLGRQHNGNPVKIGFSYNAGGVHCEAGCLRKEGGVCVERCLPNRFGMRADCNRNTGITTDYATIIIAYSNMALDVLPRSSPPLSLAGSSSSSSIGAALVGAVLGFGAVVYLKKRKAA